MKALALVALTAVPRPFAVLLAEQFRGWRRLLRAALVVLAYAALILIAVWILVVAYLEVFSI